MQNNALLAYFQRNLVTLRSKTASTSLPFRQRAEPKGPGAFKVHKIESLAKKNTFRAIDNAKKGERTLPAAVHSKNT